MLNLVRIYQALEPRRFVMDYSERMNLTFRGFWIMFPRDNTLPGKYVAWKN